MILDKFLNKRHSTKNLSDSEFENILPILAEELSQYNYHYNHSETDLRNDWLKLCSWKTSSNYINSTSRVGMKLCEHFMPNFFDIENSKGASVSKLWTTENLIKVLRWNRKSHSTPYISEIRRGIYFCCGLTKSTMYRPQMMKLACIKYDPKIVLDPCAGWGGRMLGAVSYGAHYIAFEPNTVTYNNLHKIIDFLGISDSVTLICDDARNMLKYNLPKVDMILTSPPYFDLEIYTHENTQSVKNLNTYDNWADNFLQDIIRLGIHHLNPKGVSCWNVGKVKNRDMNADVERYHTKFGYSAINTLMVTSSKRQSNQTSESKNQKNNDNTVIFASL